MKNKADIQGFTLVEVLVAMAVFSGLMMTLFSSFNAFTNSSKMIQDFEQKSRESGSGLKTMVADLEQVFTLQPPQLMDPDAEDAETQKKFGFTAARDQIEGQTVSRLDFASLSPVQFHTIPGQSSGITRLTYYVHAHGERLDLHRADTPVYFFEETEPDPCMDPVLMKDIQEFVLTFFDAEGNEYEYWDSRDEAFDNTLPIRVGITITLGTTNGQKKVSTQVALPVIRNIRDEK